MGHITDQEEKV